MLKTRTAKAALITSAPVDSRLAREVRTLAPEALHQLILGRGLDACAELVVFATPAQLTSVLDVDLWIGDHQFDAGRFGEWLEALAEIGDSPAARVIAALDAELVIAGLARYLRVFDPGTFEPTESSDDEAADRHAMMSSETTTNVPECEVGGYLVRARRTDAWDAMVALLVTLEVEHHDYFHAVMQGCRQLSNSRPEADDLDHLLLVPEQHLHDVSIERADRQARRGYLSEGDARAYLQLARHEQPTGAIVTAYFRALGDWPEPPDRGRERAFLANALIAGCSVQSRPFTPQEAADAVTCICNLGLERWPEPAKADALVADRSAVTAFEIGWSALYRDVTLFVADQLMTRLDGLESRDAAVAHGLRTFRHALASHREAGTPWLARDASDVLAMLDITAWISVLGLLDECPIVPATMTAVLERRTSPVSPTAFEFIASNAQIGDVRIFMKALPRVLDGRGP
jgi:hypothetical protein